MIYLDPSISRQELNHGGYADLYMLGEGQLHRPRDIPSLAFLLGYILNEELSFVPRLRRPTTLNKTFSRIVAGIRVVVPVVT